MNRTTLLALIVLSLVIGCPEAFAGETKTPLPEGVKQFRGTLRGRVVGHVANRCGVRLQVLEILQTSKDSRAKDPKQAVGKTMLVFADVDDQKQWLKHHLEFLDSLRDDDTIAVEVFAGAFAFSMNPQFPCNTKPSR